MFPLSYLILGAFLSIVTVTGNGIVIYLIITKQQLHNPANWIIFSLAVADLFIGPGFVLTQYLYEVFSFEYNLRYSILSFLYGASATNLCLMTVDRYIAITKPFKYITMMTTKRAAFLILSAWMASFIPHFIFYLNYTLTSSAEDPDNTKKFMYFDFTVLEMLPMIILSFVTGHVFYIARRRSRQMDIQMAQLRFNNRTTRPRKEDLTRSHWTSTTKVIGVSVTAFNICYLNELCFTVLYQLSNTKKKSNWSYVYFTNLLYVLNSAINPVAYALFKRDIKQSLKSLFRCRRRTRRVESQIFPR